MTARWCKGFVTVLLFAALEAGAAEDVAEVTKVKRVATVTGAEVEGVGRLLQGGDLLATDTSGELAVLYESSRALHREIQLGSNAKVRLDDEGIGYIVEYGETQMSGAIPVVSTPNTIIEPHSTFIVSYDPAANVTEVTVIAGRVTVRNLKGGRPRTIVAREYTRIVGDAEPTAPVFLEDQEYERRSRPFDFIGRGRPETLGVNYAVSAPDMNRLWVEFWPWPPEDKPFDFSKDAADETLLGIDF